ncbi:MAG: GxxExxY protein [Bacteroidetes bacterium]|nr:MAG: GxxExxY protein [Bacteroidota bacterium]
MITQKYVNEVSYKVIGCAMEVHKQLGVGLLESIYEAAMLEEFDAHGLKVETQVQVPVYYKGKLLEPKLRLDMLVEDLIILELKAIDLLIPIHQAQLLSYLKMAQKPKGLLINFNTMLLKNQIISLVTDTYAKLPTG